MGYWHKQKCIETTTVLVIQHNFQDRFALNVEKKRQSEREREQKEVEK